MADARPMIRVLGVDPGARWVGWCALEYSSVPALLGQGVLDLERCNERLVVRMLRSYAKHFAATRCGVERVVQINARAGFGSTMATALCAGHGVGQRIAQGLVDARFDTREFTAEDWHRHFFNARAVDGAAVKALVEGRLEGWPAISNEHARDAAAIALYAASLEAP